MKQTARYRFFHYDIFVLLTVVFTVLAIHIADGFRLYPKSYAAAQDEVADHVTAISDRIELRAGSTFNLLTYYSLVCSDYIYNPDSVFRFCEMVGDAMDRIEAVAVVPNANLYPGRERLIPLYLKQKSPHAFNGVGTKAVDFLFDLYKWDKIYKSPDGSIEFLTDPFTFQVNGETEHINLLTFPVMGRGTNVDATIVVALSMDSLAEFSRQIDWFDESRLYIVSSTGKFIIHPDQSRIGDEVGNYFYETYGQEAKEIMDSAYVDVTRLFTREVDGNIMYAMGNNTRYCTLFYTVPSHEVMAPIYSDAVFVIVVAIIGVVLILMVCAYNIKRASDHRAVQSAMDRDLEIAASVQDQFLRKEHLAIPSVDIDVRQKPAKTVAGDLYYSHLYGNDLVICVGDVTGKGVPAAMMMSGVVIMLKFLANQHKSPAEMCRMMNAELAENNKKFHFVTLFVAILDTKTGILRYCNAGHDEPIYNGSYLKTSVNMPLGVDPSQTFSEGEIVLGDGSTFVLYTDGITEAVGPQMELYGKDRLLASIASAKTCSARQLNDSILDDLQRYVDRNEQSDDITLLTLRFSRK